MPPTNFTDTDIDIDMDESSSGASDAATNPMPRPKTNKATSSRATLWLVVFAVLVIGASIAGGYFLAMQGDTGTNVSDAGLPGSESANSESMGLSQGKPLAGEDPEITPLPEGSETDSSAAKETGIDVLVDLVGARVSLDGHFLGKAPLRVRNILPGNHKIVVANADGSKTQERVVELILGEAKVITVVLNDSKEPLEVEVVKDGKSDKNRDRKGRERRKTSGDDETTLALDHANASASEAQQVLLGTLMLGSKPPCAIEIDGKSTGKSTPQRAIQLPEGLHRVVLTNEAQGIRKSFKVVIKAGRTTRAIQDLRQKL